jgi:hypothetical protein
MSHETNTNNIILENNSLKSEIASLHKRLLTMEEHTQELIKSNSKIESELSKIMKYLTLFSDDVRYELHHIKNK